MCLCAGRTAEFRSKQSSGVKEEWGSGGQNKTKLKKAAALVRRVGGEQSVAVFATGLVR